LDKFKAKIDGIKWLTDEQGELIEKDSNWDKNYPYLSRDCGADILNAIYYGKIEVSEGFNTKKVTTVDVIGLSNQENFAADSLFCEWAEIYNLPRNLLNNRLMLCKWDIEKALTTPHKIIF